MRRLRASTETATVPIMMLTAKDTELDKVVALDGGADDYLTKPFSLMELTSRCRALLRRGGMSRQVSDLLSADGIVLSPSCRTCSVDGKDVKLTLREFDLLEYLMKKPGVVFTREALLRSVWGWDFDGGYRGRSCPDAPPEAGGALFEHRDRPRRRLPLRCPGCVRRPTARRRALSSTGGIL